METQRGKRWGSAGVFCFWVLSGFRGGGLTGMGYISVFFFFFFLGRLD